MLFFLLYRIPCGNTRYCNFCFEPKSDESHNWLSFSAIVSPFSIVILKFDLSNELLVNLCLIFDISSLAQLGLKP